MIALLCLVAGARAEPTSSTTSIRFARSYGDHMVMKKHASLRAPGAQTLTLGTPRPSQVLQRAPSKANVWGVISGFDTNATIKVEVFRSSGSSDPPTAAVVAVPGSVDGDTWRAVLDPVEQSDVPYTITVTAESNGLATASAKITNVVFGDVWVCSGQSNMAFLVQNAFNGSEIVQDANNYPNIRFFTSKKIKSATPLREQPRVEQNWSVCSNVSISMDNAPGRRIEKVGSGDDDWLYMSAVCYLYAREVHKATGIPIGVLNTNWGGTPVEFWSSPEALAKCGSAPDSGGWNGMMVPLLNTTIKGAIWFQGEANTKDYPTYACTFPAMISDWRAKFAEGTGGLTDPQFPFGFVQLSAYGGNDVNIPGLRYAQTANRGFVPNDAMPNTFMAVATDLGDLESPFGSVHSRHKQEVGHRLGQAGLAVVYADRENTQAPAKNLWTGPIAVKASWSAKKDAVTVDFTNTGDSGLVVVNATAGWELCKVGSGSAPQNCTAARVAASVGSTSVNVVPDSSNVLDGAGNFGVVRYAWAAFPCQYLSCSVYSNASAQLGLLPSPPFILNITTA